MDITAIVFLVLVDDNGDDDSDDDDHDDDRNKIMNMSLF